MMTSRSLICLLENQNGGKLQKKKKLTNALWASLQRCTKTSTDEFCIFDIDKGGNLIV
jgi:hypothetical protein